MSPVSSRVVAIGAGGQTAAVQGHAIPDPILSERAALNADALIVNARGRSRSVAILPGSVTEHRIERGTVPVLVHRAGHPLRPAELLRSIVSHASPLRTN